MIRAFPDAELDRLCELTNIGAGHAATAFAQLAGKPIWMQVPRCCDESEPRSAAASSWSCGVFFEFEGGIGGLVGVMLGSAMRDSLLRRLLGESSGPHPPEEVESALMEVGNILVSHVASAVADTLGERVLPSVPALCLHDAEGQLERLARSRCAEDSLRIECELTDGKGEIGGLLVFVPDLA
jgi:chemotaxis protein CheC